MSDFRKLGPAVVDADRVRMVKPTDRNYMDQGIFIMYTDGNEDFVKFSAPPNSEATVEDFIMRAINEFYRPYNPPGAVTYEPKEAVRICPACDTKFYDCVHGSSP